jgi:hypothetical protein
VTLAVVVIVGPQAKEVSYEHTGWDQAGVLVQLGLLHPQDFPIDPTASKRLLEAVGN